MAQKILRDYARIFFSEVTAFGGNALYLTVCLLFLLQQKLAIVFILLTGLALMYLAVIIMRSFYFKERPEKREFRNLLEKMDASSFPSLHTGRVTFAGAVLIQHFNSTGYTVFLALIVLAAGYSRVYLRQHDYKDVLGGVVLGLLLFLVLA